MDQEISHLFVYGSSRKGQVNSCEKSAEYIGPASLLGYCLFDLSVMRRSYVLPSDSKQGAVSGDLFRVDAACLNHLDQEHEVSNGLYERVQVNVSTASGDEIVAWLYEGGRIAPIRIESGDWKCRGVLSGKA